MKTQFLCPYLNFSKIKKTLPPTASTKELASLLSDKKTAARFAEEKLDGHIPLLSSIYLS